MADVVSGLLAKLSELEQRGPYPDEVLSLRQAHRDIIEMYQRATEAGSNALMTVAEYWRLSTLEEVVEVLARGLGVEEQSSE